MSDIGDISWVDTIEGRIHKAALNGLFLAGLKCANEIVVRIIPSRSPQPLDRGTYRAGWGPSSVYREGEDVILENKEPHAAFVEYGVRPENVKIGRRMIEALAEWSQRKGITNSKKDALAFAWAAARNMQRKGIFNKKPGGGLRILEELVNTRAGDIVNEEVSKAIEREIANG